MAPQVGHSKSVFLCMRLSSTHVPPYRQLHCLEAEAGEAEAGGAEAEAAGRRLVELLSSGQPMQQWLVVQAGPSHKCSEVKLVEALQ